MALFPHVAARRIAEFLGGFPHHVPVATDFVDAPILTMYWVLCFEEQDAAVSFAQLRAEADRGEDVEGGEACELVDFVQTTSRMPSLVSWAFVCMEFFPDCLARMPSLSSSEMQW